MKLPLELNAARIPVPWPGTTLPFLWNVTCTRRTSSRTTRRYQVSRYVNIKARTNYEQIAMLKEQDQPVLGNKLLCAPPSTSFSPLLFSARFLFVPPPHPHPPCSASTSSSQKWSIFPVSACHVRIHANCRVCHSCSSFQRHSCPNDPSDVVAARFAANFAGCKPYIADNQNPVTDSVNGRTGSRGRCCWPIACDAGVR